MKPLSNKEKIQKFNAALVSFCDKLEKQLNKDYSVRSKELSAIREIRVANREASKSNRVVEYQLWDKKSGTELVLAARPMFYVNVTDWSVLDFKDRRRLFDESIEDIKQSDIEKFSKNF